MTYIFIENQSCVKLSVNPMFHDKSKHIEIKYYCIWDMVQRGVVKLEYVVTDKKTSNVLNKPLATIKFEYFRENIGVIHIDVPLKRE